MSIASCLRRMAASWIGLFAFLLLVTPKAHAQPAANSLSLQDLRAFRPQAGNWQIVGGATADRLQDQAFAVTPGTGVLANVQTESNRDNLFTVWDHADIELDLEVMMPRGSNSGVYLQGRYEVQLLDSWGVTELRSADLGAIYERWDESRPEGQKGYEGHPPPVNVARAPGLWQHLHIVFRAPRFDAAGQKIANAAFIEVTLNGVVLHTNVVLTGPTRASAWDDEAARGPLMIQGDHGPVALRNIRYRLFDAGSIQARDLREAYYTGAFNWQMPDLATLTQVREGAVSAPDVRTIPDEKQFAVQYTGMLEVPVAGDYTLAVAHSARMQLEVDGKLVVSDQSPNIAGPGEFATRSASLRLSRGAHRFVLTYAKGAWHSVPTALGFFVSGPGLLRTEITAPGSLPADAYAAYDILPKNEPWLQRNFFMHQGAPRTHAIAVGEPSGINYAYDLGSGALLSVWKGRFGNAATMWYQRGDLQTTVPLGSVITLDGRPGVAVLTEDSAPWPDSLAGFTLDGYKLQQGRPVFSFEVDGVRVLDQLTPAADGPYLQRRIALTSTNGPAQAWVFLAESDRIERLPSGGYALNDRTYYIENLEGGTAFVRNVGGKDELLVRVDLAGGGLVTYDLIW